VLLRAYPCCFRFENWGSSGAPNTGKTIGIPPLTGFDPSKAALEETKRRSRGSPPATSGDFQEITVAP